MRRHDHEKQLTAIIIKICDALALEHELLKNDTAVNELLHDDFAKLARRQDLSARTYQTKSIMRKISGIIKKSKTSLIATLINRLDN